MTDFIDKKAALRRYFPKPFYKLKPGQGLSIVLEAIGGELNDAATQVALARLQFLLATATGEWLKIHGVNADVLRPRGYKMPDQKYRELIKIVTNSSKNIEYIFERIFKLYFGDDVFENGIADIYSYRANEIIVQIQDNALIVASSRDLYGTHYLHGTHDPYDGESTDLWTGALGSDLPAGSTALTLASVPVGMPTNGIISLGNQGDAVFETKLFDRTGNVVTFYSKTQRDHLAGDHIEGPQWPDDYPSGYLYDGRRDGLLASTYTPGASAIQVTGAYDDLPLVGTAYIGDPDDSNFEAKGFTRVGDTLTLKGTLGFGHGPGEAVVIPAINRKIRTTLAQSITAGQSFSELTVVNSADFGIRRAAIKLALSYGNEEIVPLVSRKLGDNTKLLVDPGYTFRFDHASGEQVQLMAVQLEPRKDGTNWAFFIDDTDSLRDQFFSLLRRLKATGIKMVFDIISG